MYRGTPSTQHLHPRSLGGVVEDAVGRSCSLPQVNGSRYNYYDDLVLAKSISVFNGAQFARPTLSRCHYYIYSHCGSISLGCEVNFRPYLAALASSSKCATMEIRIWS